MHQKGFSLLEVVIAIVVLSSILTAGVLLLSSSIAQITTQQQTLQALYSAEEGIELIRNLRDTLRVNGDPFDCVFVEGAYAVTTTEPVLNSTDCALRAGIGVAPTEQDTEVMQRIIYITPEDDNQRFVITSSVVWETKHITLTEWLTKW